MTDNTMLIVNIDRSQFLCAFESYFADVLKNIDSAIGDAMRYSTLDGGKRVRPLCVYLGAKAVGGNVNLCELLPLAAAIEFVHSYSLVHDDMPEMDNDDYRRGKLSVHKRFGQATALLTGDGLLSLAMIEALKSKSNAAANEIAVAAMDMVLGQAAEFAGCNDEKQWLDMYSKKTGALIRGAFRAGAICADADSDILCVVTEFAKCIGLAFQLSDDLIDGDSSIVDVIGRERTQKLLDEQFEKANLIIDKFYNANEMLAFARELRFRKS